jgi:ubiquinone/menaquinone biosynthesis C-methylase UbiE
MPIAKDMTYALENKKEFDRLEKQSQSAAYDYQKELSRFSPSNKGKILDAGCGSGVVTRYLAERYPLGSVFGCDASIDRVTRAQQVAAHLKNVQFSQENLTQLTYKSDFFDGIVCRFVLEHLTPEIRDRAMSELVRCLKPKASLCLVDIDGLLYNIFPQTPFVTEVLSILQKILPIDLTIGRKLPQLMDKHGLTSVTWRAELMQFQGEALHEEIKMVQERFLQTTPLLVSLLGSEQKVSNFQREYVECLKQPSSVLFYNKFIVIGKKPVKHLKALK